MAFITITPRLQVVVGGVYIDRLDLKFLPAGGIICTPHEKARYELVFPKPKLSRYLLTSARSNDWWMYFTAEYGDGSWTIERAAGFDDRIDINDIRLIGGLEILPAKAADGTPATLGRRMMLYFEGATVRARDSVRQPVAADVPVAGYVYVAGGGTVLVSCRVLCEHRGVRSRCSQSTLR